jgi:hypothetical protein
VHRHDAVGLRQHPIQRIDRRRPLDQARHELLGQIRALQTHRRAVGQAQPLQQHHGFTGREVESRRHVIGGRLSLEAQRATGGAVATTHRFLSKTEQAHRALLDFRLADEDALALLALEQPFARQRIECLDDGDATDAVLLAQLANGRDLLARVPFARRDAIADCQPQAVIQRRGTAGQSRGGHPAAQDGTTANSGRTSSQPFANPLAARSRAR